MALSLSQLTNVLNEQNVQTVEKLDEVLPGGVAARWEASPQYVGTEARRRVLIAPSGAVTRGAPLVHEANACVLEFTETPRDGASRWRLLAAAPPRLHAIEELSVNERAQVNADLSSGVYDILHVEDGTAVTLYWAGPELGWAFASANSWDLVNQRWMGSRTFGEYFEDVALSSAAFVAATGFTGITPCAASGIDSAAGVGVESTSPLVAKYADDAAAVEGATGTTAEHLARVDNPAGSNTKDAVMGVDGATGGDSETKSDAESADDAESVDDTEAGTDADSDAGSVDDAGIVDGAGSVDDAESVDAAESIDAAESDDESGNESADDAVQYETEDIFPRLPREYCYTLGFRHPDLHPFAPHLDPMRLWFIRTYDPRTCSPCVNNNPLEAVAGQRRWDSNTSADTLATLTDETRTALDDAKKWLDPTAAACHSGTIQINRRPVYGYILRAAANTNRPDVLIESPLFRAIRKLVYQRPPHEINQHIRPQDRFRYMAYQSALGHTSKIFMDLFPRFAEQVVSYQSFTNNVVDQMLEQERHRTAKRTYRQRQSVAANFATTLLDHVRKHNTVIDPHLPQARTCYYDAVVQPQNALVFFTAYNQDVAARRARRRRRHPRAASAARR